MQAIKRKLRSRRGASITFALLLFLVCAVLSSVIIVAASTASGRMSNLAETDRRYYAVTSAAELMKDLLKEPVSIVKQTETTIVQEKTEIREDKETRKIIPTGEVDENGQPLTEETVSTETTWTSQASSPVKTTAEKEYLLLKEAKDIQVEGEESELDKGNQISGDEALGFGLTTASVANEAAYKVYKNEAATPREIQLKPSVDTIPEVKINEELKPKTGDRLLTLKIFDTGEKPYTLELQFQGTQPDPTVITGPTIPEAPSSVQTIDTKTEQREEIENGVTIQVFVTTTITTTVSTETSKRTDTSISTINWDLVDIRTKTSG